MDVGGWLRNLGFGQYEANFRDNKIDADVLPQLTADDLKDIGGRRSAQAACGYRGFEWRDAHGERSWNSV
jgi:SAM domain (Sterile alpha motif)